MVTIHSYIQIDAGHFKIQLCNFYIFFYYTQTDLNTLTICFGERVKGVKFSVSD